MVKTKSKKAENKFYTVGTWHGRENFECKHCAFATLDRRDMTKHSEGHIRGTPELAGYELPVEDLPEVKEDHGLSTYDQGEEKAAPTEEKETYQGPKRAKERKVKTNG